MTGSAEITRELDEAIDAWAGDEVFDSVLSRSREDVIEFVEVLAIICRQSPSDRESSNSCHSFVANTSLSGGRHPCSNSICRGKKLDELIAFASLYADEVYIQNPFETLAQTSPEHITELARAELVQAIINYIQLRPLIKTGIVKYAHNMIALCERHANEIAKPLSDEIEEKENLLHEILHEHLLESCSVTFDVGSNVGPFLEFVGPASIIEHGRKYLYIHEPHPEFFDSLKKQQTPYELSRTEIVEGKILSLIISPILRDLSNQEWHSALYGTSYLCDQFSQIDLASKLNPGAYALNAGAFYKALRHNLPTIHCSDGARLVGLREKESEAFAVYRDKMRLMMQESASCNESQLTKMFRDEVVPELNRIDKKVREWKTTALGDAREKIVFGSGIVAIGLFTGILPPNIGQIVAAIGGASALTGILQDLNKSLKGHDEARKNDFYFLWQARGKEI